MAWVGDGGIGLAFSHNTLVYRVSGIGCVGPAVRRQNPEHLILNP